MKSVVKSVSVVTLALVLSSCIVPLLPGAAQVRMTTNAADVADCTDVGNVAGIGGDLSTIYVHQMQNQAVSMDADTVFRSGNGGIAYRCKPVHSISQ